MSKEIKKIKMCFFIFELERIEISILAIVFRRILARI
jgi:hypothetical protein